MFTLLEMCYGAFDKIANHRGIFKVETIGDCYVAVSGIPRPRQDHAVAMAKFARDAMDAMKHELHKLAPRLGEETMALNMRIGELWHVIPMSVQSVGHISHETCCRCVLFCS